MKTKILLLALCLLPSVAGAEIYKYTDENGRTRYSDHPPANGKATKLDVRRPGAEPVKTQEQIDLEEQAKALARERSILKQRNDKALAEQEERERQARIRAQEEADRKFTGCKLAEQLKTVSKGKPLTQKLINSASSKNYSTWDTLDSWVSTRILSYEPVCGNQTRYIITINDANYVWEIKSDIAR